jgi:hypothetical protein
MRIGKKPRKTEKPRKVQAEKPKKVQAPKKQDLAAPFDPVARDVVYVLPYMRNGYIHSRQVLPGGIVVYHVYIIINQGQDPPLKGCWMTTCFLRDLTPKFGKPAPLDPSDMWWVTHASKYLDDPALKDKFLFWPSPSGEPAWPIGSKVSVPVDEYGCRQCAQVVGHILRDGGWRTIVQFPVLVRGSGQYGIRSEFESERVRGPHVFWNLQSYDFGPFDYFAVPARLVPAVEPPAQPSFLPAMEDLPSSSSASAPAPAFASPSAGASRADEDLSFLMQDV